MTWLWLVLYALFPPLVVALYLQHARRMTSEPPAALELGSRFRAGTAAIGLALGLFGLGLIIAPRTFDGLWPWPLTPLTARAVGAWLVSLGIALFAVAREHDWAAIRLIAPQGIIVSGLLLAGVIRFRHDVDWNQPQTWVYVGGVSVALVGAAVIYAALETRWRQRTSVPAPGTDAAA